MVGVGLVVAPRTSSARALPGPRQGSCHDTVVVPGKDLVEGLVDSLGKGLAKDHRLLILVFTKICMPPQRRLPSSGSNVVEGVGTLRVKGGSPIGTGQVAPARFLSGLRKPPRQGPCRGSPPRPSAFCVSGSAWSSRLMPLLPLPRQAWPGAWGCDCSHTSKGVQIGVPTFVHRQEPQGLGHI